MSFIIAVLSFIGFHTRLKYPISILLSILELSFIGRSISIKYLRLSNKLSSLKCTIDNSSICQFEHPFSLLNTLFEISLICEEFIWITINSNSVSHSGNGVHRSFIVLIFFNNCTSVWCPFLGTTVCVNKLLLLFYNEFRFETVWSWDCFWPCFNVEESLFGDVFISIIAWKLYYIIYSSNTKEYQLLSFTSSAEDHFYYSIRLKKLKTN